MTAFGSAETTEFVIEQCTGIQQEDSLGALKEVLAQLPLNQKTV
jgi:hypothetical protein